MKLKLLLYCTKKKPYLYKTDATMIEKMDGDYHIQLNKAVLNDNCLNGKIVAECDYEVEEIFEELYGDIDWQHDYLPTTNTMSIVNLERESCLSREELYDYCNGYAIHIKNLHIFDEPKELSDFNKIIETTYGEEPDATITRAPQNMMRCCYEKKPKEWETGVLISIQPQCLCKILNGEKTVETRKRVLKEML